MALADPQSVTVSGDLVSLARTGLSMEEGRFVDGTGEYNLSVRHSSGKRNRHTVKVQRTALVSNPLVPSTYTPISYSAHIVVDIPNQGVTLDEAVALAGGLVDWATGTNLGKVVAGES